VEAADFCLVWLRPERTKAACSRARKGYKGKGKGFGPQSSPKKGSSNEQNWQKSHPPVETTKNSEKQRRNAQKQREAHLWCGKLQGIG